MPAKINILSVGNLHRDASDYNNNNNNNNNKSESFIDKKTNYKIRPIYN